MTVLTNNHYLLQSVLLIVITVLSKLNLVTLLCCLTTLLALHCLPVKYTMTWRPSTVTFNCSSPLSIHSGNTHTVSPVPSLKCPSFDFAPDKIPPRSLNSFGIISPSSRHPQHFVHTSSIALFHKIVNVSYICFSHQTRSFLDANTMCESHLCPLSLT